MRWLLRFVATICLFIAVVCVVIDAARSVGMSRLVFTPLGDMMITLRLATPETLRSSPLPGGDLVMWGTVNEILLQSPVWLLFGVVALAFYIAGHGRDTR